MGGWTSRRATSTRATSRSTCDTARATRFIVMGATTKVRGQIGQRWGTGDYENPFERYSGEWERNERHGQGTWAGTRGDTPYAAKEVHYEGMWADGLRCGAVRARDEDGSAFEGDYWNDHRPRACSSWRTVIFMKVILPRMGATASASAPTPDGSQFIGEWRDDKPDTDAGKWVGVSEIEDLAETCKGQSTKKDTFQDRRGASTSWGRRGSCRTCARLFVIRRTGALRIWGYLMSQDNRRLLADEDTSKLAAAARRPLRVYRTESISRAA